MLFFWSCFFFLGVGVPVLLMALLGVAGDADLALLGSLLVNVAIVVLGFGVLGVLLVVSFCCCCS